jgi:putative spermidine/putrescine transport system ATP-binding protein
MNRLPATMEGSDQVSVLGGLLPVQGHAADLAGEVGVLVRPEGLRISAQPGSNGIVTDRTFLGSVTRVSVLLVSGAIPVKVDQPSTVAAELLPGMSVQVSLPGEPVLVTARA